MGDTQAIKEFKHLYETAKEIANTLPYNHSADVHAIYQNLVQFLLMKAEK